MAHTRPDGQHTIWTGFMLKGKYPVYSYVDDDGKSRSVRVARWFFTRDNPGEGGYLKTTCKEPRCVEPTHHQTQEHLKERKARTRRAKAIRHQRVILVVQLAGVGYSRREIADNLNLPYETVCRIVKQSRKGIDSTVE